MDAEHFSGGRKCCERSGEALNPIVELSDVSHVLLEGPHLLILQAVICKLSGRILHEKLAVGKAGCTICSCSNN